MICKNTLTTLKPNNCENLAIKMSDLFTGLQQSLRDFKNNHGMDMSHPNGSIIYGKPYPAINKSVWIDTTTKNNKNTFQYRFDIPLEMDIVYLFQNAQLMTIHQPSHKYIYLLDIYLNNQMVKM